MRRVPRHLVICAVLATVGAVASTALLLAPADAASRLGPTYRVTGVSDGDTIKVSLKGTIERVRLIGIDTPELGRDGSPDQCHARAARTQMSRLVAGKRVHLRRDRTQANRDVYGRLLRYVYTSRGRTDVAKSLIARGHGRQYTYKHRSYQHRSSYRSAQKRARSAKRGLWGSCASSTSSSPATPTGSCRIKGNISSSGEKIYHVPGQQYYDQTVVTPSRGERWFCTEAEARAAGWRRSAV